MMTRKKGFLPLLLLSLFLGLAAFTTLIPFDEAQKVSSLGYRSLSSWAPYSTALFLLAALAVQVVRKRFFREFL